VHDGLGVHIVVDQELLDHPGVGPEAFGHLVDILKTVLVILGDREVVRAEQCEGVNPLAGSQAGLLSMVRGCWACARALLVVSMPVAPASGHGGFFLQSPAIECRKLVRGAEAPAATARFALGWSNV
jgi:hypothetical protein